MNSIFFSKALDITFQQIEWKKKEEPKFLAFYQKEIIIQIFTNLNALQLYRVSGTCRAFYAICQQLCEKLIKQCWPQFTPLCKTQNRVALALRLSHIEQNILVKKFKVYELIGDVNNKNAWIGSTGNKIVRLSGTLDRRDCSLQILNISKEAWVHFLTSKKNEAMIAYDLEAHYLCVAFRNLQASLHGIKLWNIFSGKQLHSFEIDTIPTEVWLRKSVLFVSCQSKDHNNMTDLVVWEIKSGKELWRIEQLTSMSISFLSVIPVWHSGIAVIQVLEEEIKLVLTSNPLTFQRRSLKDGKKIEEKSLIHEGLHYIKEHEISITRYRNVVSVHKNGVPFFSLEKKIVEYYCFDHTLITIDSDGYLEEWDLKTKDLLHQIKTKIDISHLFVFSPIARFLLLIVTVNGSLTLWNIKDQKCVYEDSNLLSKHNFISFDSYRIIAYSLGQMWARFKILDFSGQLAPVDDGELDLSPTSLYTIQNILNRKLTCYIEKISK